MCMFVCTYAHVYIRMYVCMYMCMYVRMFCMYTHTYMWYILLCCVSCRTNVDHHLQVLVVPLTPKSSETGKTSKRYTSICMHVYCMHVHMHMRGQCTCTVLEGDFPNLTHW